MGMITVAVVIAVVHLVASRWFRYKELETERDTLKKLLASNNKPKGFTPVALHPMMQPRREPVCHNTEDNDMSKKTHVITYYKGRGGWRYKIASINGNVIFRSSEGYANKDDAAVALGNACEAWVRGTMSTAETPEKSTKPNPTAAT